MRHPETLEKILGKETVLTAASAIRILEAAVSEGLSVSLSEIRENIFGRPLIGNPRGAGDLSFMMGLASSGLRAGGPLNGKDLIRNAEALRESVRRHLAYVIQVSDSNDGSQTNDHRSYHAVADSGCVQFFASGVQEAVDLSIIAHKVAELSLNPALVAIENAGTYAEKVTVPELEILKQFLGDADDLIECPTPAQKMIFGKLRRRIPNWFHFDLPTISGVTKTGQAFTDEMAAHRMYFSDTISNIAEKVFEEYEKLTGRNYSPFAAYKIEDAEYVVLVQGSLFHHSSAVVDHLRSKKIKAGCLHLRMMRPFPGKELCELVSGKKALTVLEKVGQPLNSDAPIYSEVLSALDKAVQNSAKKKSPAYPTHPVMKDSQRPVLYSGRCAANYDSPGFADISAVFENMINVGRRTFFAGIDFTNKSSAYPKQQILLQNLNRDYPELAEQTLQVDSNNIPAAEQTYAIRWRLNDASVLPETVAGMLSSRWNARVHTNVRAVNESIPCNELNISRQPWPYPLTKDHDIDCLITNAAALNSVAIFDGMKKEADILVLVSSAEETIRLSQAVKERMMSMQFKLHRLTAASEEISLLYGAMLHFTSRFFAENGTADKEVSMIEKYYKDVSGIVLSEDQKAAVLNGLNKIEKSLDIRALTVDEKLPKEVQLALRKYEDHGPAYSKISQFYDRSAIFYEQGAVNEIVADPFQSLPVIPAATANFIQAGIAREFIPEFDPSKCTGCAQCAVYCPESAMPPIVISAESMIRSAVENAQTGGISMTQLTPPVIKNLAKLVNQTLSVPAEKTNSLGEVLPQAFDKFAVQMKADGERLQTMTKEFQTILPSLSRLPVALTNVFFEVPESQMKGSGSLFSVVVNTQSCTGCGVCVEVCKDGALALIPQHTELTKKHQTAFRMWEELPDTPADMIQKMVQDDAYDPFAAIALSRNYYLSMAGGVASNRGISEKIMTHLVASTAESFLQSETNKQLKEIDRYIQGLNEKIQNKLKEALPSGNYESLLSSISATESVRVSVDALFAKLSETQRFGVIETAWMERLVLLIKDLKQLSFILSKGPSGIGRSRFGTVISTSDAMAWTKELPYNAFTCPAAVYDDPGSVDYIRGLCLGHIRQMIDNVKLLRRAELEIQNQYNPVVHDEKIARLNWNDLNESEKGMIPPVLVFVDPKKMSELNLLGHMSLLSSDLPVKVFVFDSAKGTAEYWRERMAVTTAVLSNKKTYLLQASLADPAFLFKGLMEGLRQPKPAFFHLLAPDMPGSDRTVDYPALFQLALQSRAFPIFRSMPSANKTLYSETLDFSSNPASFEKYSPVQIAEGENKINYTTTFADWAFEQPEYRSQFELLSSEDRNAIPAAEFLALPDDARGDKKPYIQRFGDQGTPQRYSVSKELILATEAANASWTMLREMAGMLTPYPQQLKERIDEEWAAKHESELAQLKKDFEEKLRQQESAQMEAVKNKLRDKLMALSGYGHKN